jgi:TPP-dependent pyruvate/acetoin dehydrogenase alpha subunit
VRDRIFRGTGPRLAGSMTLLHEFRAALLRAMMRIRCVEETLADLYPRGEMRTPTHFSIGQEAVAVGVCGALRRDDVAYSGHRCHAHYLAKGGDLNAMVAELFGKETGCARGRGGSVHLNDPEAGLVASSAILGETMAVAAGSALAFQMDGAPRIAVAFFGDGVVEEGIYHETLNLSAVKKLPLLLVCENNGYSTHTRLDVRQPTDTQIWERVRTYSIPAALVDGNDVFAVHAAARTAVEHIRRGAGPYFLEATTYRWREHVGPLWDHDRGYRSKAEVDAWIARCPIERARKELVAAGVCTEAEVDGWRGEQRAEVDEAISLARAASFPAVTDLLLGTY